MATSCRFIGYDEVCCMAAEAKDQRRALPIAVLGTVAGGFHSMPPRALVELSGLIRCYVNIRVGVDRVDWNGFL